MWYFPRFISHLPCCGIGMSFYIHIKPDHNYRAEMRRVKVPSLEFNSGQMTLILPEAANPDEALKKNIRWIGQVHARVMHALQEARKKDLRKRSQEEFRQLVWDYAEKCSTELGVDFYKIRFKKLHEKWASCDTAGNLTVNTLLKRLPDHLVEYVIYHEIVHRLEMNHGKNFWKHMAAKYPDRGRMDMELFVYWLMVEGVVGD